MNKWKILKRYDAPDGARHMGLMILTPKHRYNLVYPQLDTFAECQLNQGQSLQIQGLKVKFELGLELGFIYSRSAPSFKEIDAIIKTFKDCHFLTGDLNLSHRKPEDKKKYDDVTS